MILLPVLLLSIISIVSSCVTRFHGLEAEAESEMSKRIIDGPNWYCGTKGLVEDAAWAVMGMCIDRQYDLNHCCAIHDDCYDQQLGQEKCDQNFCDCNWKAAEPAYWKFRCAPYAAAACKLVKSFGVGAYEAAGKHLVTVTPYVLKNDVDLVKIYPTIFDNCKLQNATFSSCAYNFDTCVAENWKSYSCHDILKDCLTATRDSRESDAICDSAVQKVTASIKDTYLYW